jgi:hypothetical protein
MRVILEKVSESALVSAKFIRHKFSIDDSDSEINEIMKVAISDLELERGISLQEKTWKIIHTNNFVNLDRGPVQDIVSMKCGDKNIKPITISRTHDNVMLKFDESYVQEGREITVVYKAGYCKDNLPDCLQQTICNKFYSLYLKNSRARNCSRFNAFSDVDKYFIGAKNA